MPSKRYSFVRGRPPLMRGSCEFGGSATPGASVASVMKVRPFSGSCTTCSCSTTVPRLAVSARSIGASADDGHLFAEGPDAEREVDARLFARDEADAFAAHRLETGELDLEAVFAGRQARRRVDAIASGDHDSLHVGTRSR